MESVGLWIAALAIALIGLVYFVSGDLLIAGTFWLVATFSGLLAIMPGQSEGEE